MLQLALDLGEAVVDRLQRHRHLVVAHGNVMADLEAVLENADEDRLACRHRRASWAQELAVHPLAGGGENVSVARVSHELQETHESILRSSSCSVLISCRGSLGVAAAAAICRRTLTRRWWIGTSSTESTESVPSRVRSTFSAITTHEHQHTAS